MTFEMILGVSAYALLWIATLLMAVRFRKDLTELKKKLEGMEEKNSRIDQNGLPKKSRTMWD